MMQKHNADLLRAVLNGTRGVQTISDRECDDALADLRAEAFWNDRAPLLNDEVLALRPLEKFARQIFNAGGLDPADLVALNEALVDLDAVRAAQAKKSQGGAAAS